MLHSEEYNIAKNTNVVYLLAKTPRGGGEHQYSYLDPRIIETGRHEVNDLELRQLHSGRIFDQLYHI